MRDDSFFLSPHWFVALNAASLPLAGENSFINRHDSPSDLSLHLARDAFGHMVLSNQEDDSTAWFADERSMGQAEIITKTSQRAGTEK